MNIQPDNFVTGDPAFAVDRRGQILFWNDSAEQTFGYPRAEALGKKCWKLLCGLDSYGNTYCVRHCPVRKMAFQHDPVHHFMATFETASHQTRQLSISCVIISDESGDEMLLHVCQPDRQPLETDEKRLPPELEPETLSEREIEVLALLADKVSTRDIAEKLDISIRTVRTHIQHLMYKLRVHKRREAILAGKRLKLI
jgi:DNA-binding CsgD family transcriptional regulator